MDKRTTPSCPQDLNETPSSPPSRVGNYAGLLRHSQHSRFSPRSNYNSNHPHLQCVEESDEELEKTAKSDSDQSNYSTGNAIGVCYGQRFHTHNSQKLTNACFQSTQSEKVADVHYQLSESFHSYRNSDKDQNDSSVSHERIKGTDISKKQNSYIPCLTRSAILKQCELESSNKISAYNYHRYHRESSFPESLGKVDKEVHARISGASSGDTEDNIFTIGGQRVVISSVHSDDEADVSKPRENNLVVSGRRIENPERHSEDSTTTSVSIEKKRRRRQCVSESFSIIFFAGFIILSSLAPWLSIPSYVVSNPDQDMFKLIMFLCALISFMFLFIGCIIGNFYWYFDGQTGRWRVMLHCGKGPKPYYWGWNFSSERNKSQKNQSEHIETV
ncbi:uncharacterized protein LOC111086298 [Limulus polyphemus]|uniref:Uncharacterized protein LOC111086298 n=1 Tax=Limulus polyphemus TaxID=6850 RepID=A0ABM1SL61_LIMPO|nr:uncharacterized protein LOC111086298 [Limulus polyphemus]